MSGIKTIPGDCRLVLAELPADSIDACVTDPPYELAFMGRAWDRSGVAFNAETWRAVWRVLRPGAHMLAFGGTRTSHRMVCAIEDAGFEIRDCIMWLYGSGFPKSLNIGNGWGTALKPAYEPIVLARKPLGAGTVAANVLAHGTGALNVDGCRVAHSGADGCWGEGTSDGSCWSPGRVNGGSEPEGRRNALGRWPANVLHDGSPEVEAAFAVFGTSESSDNVRCNGLDQGNVPFTSSPGGVRLSYGHADTGSASRFFYAAKADTADRADSRHPTVKPVDLMRWLVRLITPPGGTVLDPFAGSGTTGEAAMLEGMRAILIEQDAQHMADIRHRMNRWSGQDLPLFTSWPPADDPADTRMADLFAGHGT